MSEEAQKVYALSSLILVIIFILYTISAPLFKVTHFHYIHESGICMMIGVVVTILGSIFVPEVINSL